MILYSPIGQPHIKDHGPATRPRDLAGLRVGLFDNTKAPVDHIMTHLAARLQERVPGIQTFYVSKQHPSLPAEPEVLEALRQHADVVINALGD